MAQLHEEHDDLREQREVYKNEANRLSAEFKKYFSDVSIRLKNYLFKFEIFN